jgi:hypothetical protein
MPFRILTKNLLFFGMATGWASVHHCVTLTTSHETQMMMTTSTDTVIRSSLLSHGVVVLNADYNHTHIHHFSSFHTLRCATLAPSERIFSLASSVISKTQVIIEPRQCIPDCLCQWCPWTVWAASVSLVRIITFSSKRLFKKYVSMQALFLLLYGIWCTVGTTYNVW